MATETKSRERVVFGDFQLDCRTGELRGNGTALKLQPQPAKVLAILVSRAGEVVTRQELTDQVWGSDTYVDFEHGLNYAIRQIRSVLADDPEQPRFLETIPKRGYRFVAAVSPVQAPTTETPPPTKIATAKLGRRFVLISLGAAAIVIAALAAIRLWPRKPAATHGINSLAVLPLRNLSNDPEQEYFSEGMTDELITALAKVPKLKVISHTSVERYKDAKRPLPEIARELGVDAVVEGTVLRSGDRVRITTQLIDAGSDQHLWAESYERELKDVLSLQDEVAIQVAAQIGVQTSPAKSDRRPLNLEAHEAYLKGNFYWNQQTGCDGFQKAIQYFKQSLEKDPNYSQAYVGQAGAYYQLGAWNCADRRTAFADAKRTATRALELDPTSGSAHAWLGNLAYDSGWDQDTAAKEFTQAITLEPNDAIAHLSYAAFLVYTGRPEQGMRELRQAQALDPTSEVTNEASVVILYLGRQYDEAIAHAQAAVDLHPESANIRFWQGVVYERKEMYRQAVDAYINAHKLEGEAAADLEAERNAFQRSGIRGYWQHAAAESERGPSDVCWQIIAYSHLGDREQLLDH